MRIIFIFIDGFGIGKQDPGSNPIIAASPPGILNLFNNYCLMPTDVLMGVPGLPQSATGQTAIFTGINAAAAAGRHINAQPTMLLKSLISRTNMFAVLKRKGHSAANANVYRPEYLQKMLYSSDKLHKPSVTSVMTMSAGVRFRLVDDFKNGTGIYHDLTGKMLKDHGCSVEPVTPAESARRLYRISKEYDFTLFEHFLTDVIGHTMDMELAISEIMMLDEFLGTLAGLVDEEKEALFITSDHGNIEDISIKTHTMNKVPTLLQQSICRRAGIRVGSLPDIVDAVLRVAEL